MALPNTERGAASIRIELADGNITVYHGTDGNILHEAKNVAMGSWLQIWETVRNLQTVTG